MAERDQMLTALVKEVLGPRHGSHEVLPENQDPRDEYITGVLAPARATRQTVDIESEVESLIEETFADEVGESGYEPVVLPESLSPSLDPRSLPRSIGLSFTVMATDGPPKIEICATWARYQQLEDGWHRQPAFYLTGSIQVTDNIDWSPEEGVSIILRSKSLSEDKLRVTIFLVNVTEHSGNGWVGTPLHIFQPQIRVHCDPGTNLVPVLSTDISQSQEENPGSYLAEDASLAMLYRSRAALARGHLCGAMWKDIDPERPHYSIQQDLAPFFWTDSVEVPSSDRDKFSPADVRTELVPCYPVEAPIMGWIDNDQPAPELSTEILAETWTPVDIRSRLEPLVNGYEAWIRTQEQECENLSPPERTLAQNNIQNCQEAAYRIRQAIELIINDKDVRLAFCFANKTIEIQSRWKNEASGHSGEVLTWRPFQIAFILLNIPAIANPLHPDRQICDLLWFPTGGGKTEAYLGLAAFTLALRRRHARQNQNGDRTGAGTGVLSRYTLRLLSIQQFRRALGVITACEFLRVWNLNTHNEPVGWRPQEYFNQEDFIWGGIRFSAGLWLGANVAPNHLLSVTTQDIRGRLIRFVGALEILQGARPNYDGHNEVLRHNLRGVNLDIKGEPAQVLTCPACLSNLAIPDQGFSAGRHILHFVFRGEGSEPPLNQFKSTHIDLTINSANLTPHAIPDYKTLTLDFSLPDGSSLSAEQVDEWWHETISSALGPNVELLVARPSRPGYFILTFDNSLNNLRNCDFDIYCPNPECDLNLQSWAEQTPIRRDQERASGATISLSPTPETHGLPPMENYHWQLVPRPFGCNDSTQGQRISTRIPIPALTVDDQVYHRCPSLVIATVDKFARLAFEPKAASMFGNVNYYHSRWGYYREGSPPSSGSLSSNYRPHPPGFSQGNPLHKAVHTFRPPDLILQDELHLIEGPLGSMVGLYETAIDLLCHHNQDNQTIIPKYIASTATVRQAESQVKALYDRSLSQFPPWAIAANDRFFASEDEIHPLDCDRPGRLYVGVCAPGKGAQTPIVRIWSNLLQTVHEHWENNQTPEVDNFYTLVGYFNAIRELAGALSLFRQDIPERISFRAGPNSRHLDRWLELSSRINSLDLPSLLDQLTIPAPDTQDVVFATSMFGTGVDVDRLGLMVVNGQPKTTASYIQATGRVGRQKGGLVITFFRASRPRDLDHYEFFTGYHRAIYRHVEPITVFPFSPRARDRALGPLVVTLLRNAIALGGQDVPLEWRVQQRLSGEYYSLAHRMGTNRYDPEVITLPDLIQQRANNQPTSRIPPPGVIENEVISEIDIWAALARLYPDTNHFVYNEPSLLRPPERHVVLGDAHHRAQGLSEAYENTPQSLREVEETTSFKT